MFRGCRGGAFVTPVSSLPYVAPTATPDAGIRLAVSHRAAPQANFNDAAQSVIS